MATVTKIVRGKYFDGCDDGDAGYVAEKINDTIDAIGGGTLKSVSTFRAGTLLIATIVYETA